MVPLRIPRWHGWQLPLKDSRDWNNRMLCESPILLCVCQQLIVVAQHDISELSLPLCPLMETVFWFPLFYFVLGQHECQVQQSNTACNYGDGHGHSSEPIVVPVFPPSTHHISPVCHLFLAWCCVASVDQHFRIKPLGSIAAVSSAKRMHHSHPTPTLVISCATPKQQWDWQQCLVHLHSSKH